MAHAITAEISNAAFMLRVHLAEGEVRVSLTERQGDRVLADGPYYYRFEFPSAQGRTVYERLENPDVTGDANSIMVSGSVGEISVQHRFVVSGSEHRDGTHFLEETFELKNEGAEVARLLDFEAGMLYRIGDAHGRVPEELSGDRMAALPFRHRAESAADQDEEYGFEELLRKCGSERRHVDPYGGEMPSRHRHAEGWAWTHGDHALGLFKLNQQEIEFSVISTLVLPDGVYLRYGGAAMIDSLPSVLGRIAAGETVSLGVMRYQTVECGYERCSYAFRDFLDDMGCRFPDSYDPPVHWNEIYDNPDYFLSSPGNPPSPRRTRHVAYTRSLIEEEARKASNYSCESLYLDPGWDTEFGTFLWDSQRLGSAPDFMKAMKQQYSLAVSLHCPLATWMAREKAGVPSWPESSAIVDRDGKTVENSVCLGSQSYLAEAERRLLDLCGAGAAFLMFDGNWWNGGCWNPDHGHPVPYTKEDHCRASLDLAMRVHRQYPDVLIEMHDMVAGGARYRHTPVYYKYGLPGSYDENWGMELMWQPMEDIISGRARALYYYNLGCNVPLYLHVDLRDDNRNCLVLWWYASTCRHLGIGGTHEDPQTADAHVRAMQRYRRLDRFYKRGVFYGISEEIHVHVLPDEGAFVVNLFNVSDETRIARGSISVADLDIDPDDYYVMPKGGVFDRLNQCFTIERRLPPWGAQVAEVHKLA